MLFNKDYNKEVKASLDPQGYGQERDIPNGTPIIKLGDAYTVTVKRKRKEQKDQYQAFRLQRRGGLCNSTINDDPETVYYAKRHHVCDLTDAE